LFCYVISFMTGASVIILIPHKRIPLISSWGTKTENVYFWHYGLFCLMIKYLNISDLCALNIWGKLSYILIAIALTILLSSIGIFDYPLLILKKCIKAKN
jgi:hypothetical protein